MFVLKKIQYLQLLTCNTYLIMSSQVQAITEVSLKNLLLLSKVFVNDALEWLAFVGCLEIRRPLNFSTFSCSCFRFLFTAPALIDLRILEH